MQRKIILYFAERGPQTINQTAKDIHGHYKSSWIAFDTLKKKGLIQEVKSKDYRGREYPQFWITEKGIFLALCEGAKSDILLRRTREIYPEERELQFLIETVPILGKHAFDVLRLAVLTDGQIEQADVESILVAQIQNQSTPEATKQYIAVLKKYPEQHQRHVDYVKQTQKKLSDLSDLL